MISYKEKIDNRYEGYKEHNKRLLRIIALVFLITFSLDLIIAISSNQNNELGYICVNLLGGIVAIKYFSSYIKNRVLISKIDYLRSVIPEVKVNKEGRVELTFEAMTYYLDCVYEYSYNENECKIWIKGKMFKQGDHAWYEILKVPSYGDSTRQLQYYLDTIIRTSVNREYENRNLKEIMVQNTIDRDRMFIQEIKHSDFLVPTKIIDCDNEYEYFQTLLSKQANYVEDGSLYIFTNSKEIPERIKKEYPFTSRIEAREILNHLEDHNNDSDVFCDTGKNSFIDSVLIDCKSTNLSIDSDTFIKIMTGGYY